MHTRILPLLTLFLALVGFFLPAPSAHANAADVKISLTPSPGVTGIKGTAKYSDRGGERQFQVEIEASLRRAGAVLTIVVDGLVAGEVKLDTLGKGRLSLNSKAGAIVPAIAAGSTVRVVAGDGSVLLSGSF